MNDNHATQRGPRSAQEIALSAAQLARIFTAAVSGLVLLHALVQIARFTSGNDRLFGLVYMFSLGAERNVPALYSTFALLFAAGLLLVIALRSTADRPYWWVLTLAFVFLALDEALEIHEKLIVPLRTKLHTGGALYYAWVIPYGIGTLVFALAYLRFLSRLPRRTAVLLVISGAVYVAGALGLEMVGGALKDSADIHPIAYVLVQTLEEILEMGGIVLFIYTLTDYASRQLGGITVRLG